MATAGGDTGSLHMGWCIVVEMQTVYIPNVKDLICSVMLFMLHATVCVCSDSCSIQV